MYIYQHFYHKLASMKNFTSLTIFLFLSTFISLSQEKPCGTDDVVNKILEKNPEKIV